MPTVRRTVLSLLIAACSLVGLGCADPVREGLSGGLEQGLAAVIAGIFEDAVDDSDDGG